MHQARYLFLNMTLDAKTSSCGARKASCTKKYGANFFHFDAKEKISMLKINVIQKFSMLQS